MNRRSMSRERAPARRRRRLVGRVRATLACGRLPEERPPERTPPTTLRRARPQDARGRCAGGQGAARTRPSCSSARAGPSRSCSPSASHARSRIACRAKGPSARRRPRPPGNAPAPGAAAGPGRDRGRRPSWLLPVLLLLAVAIAYGRRGAAVCSGTTTPTSRDRRCARPRVWRIWTDLGAPQQYTSSALGVLVPAPLWATPCRATTSSASRSTPSRPGRPLILRRSRCPGRVLAAWCSRSIRSRGIGRVDQRAEEPLSGCSAWRRPRLPALRRPREGRLYGLALASFIWACSPRRLRRSFQPLLVVFCGGAARSAAGATCCRSFVLRAAPARHPHGVGGTHLHRCRGSRVPVHADRTRPHRGPRDLVLPRQAVRPVNLAFIYPRWESARTPVQYLYPARCRRPAGRPVAPARALAGALADSCVLRTLFPGWLLQLFPFRYAFVADHFQYLPAFPSLPSRPRA